jgi:hypothetical protein
MERAKTPVESTLSEPVMQKISEELNNHHYEKQSNKNCHQPFDHRQNSIQQKSQKNIGDNFNRSSSVRRCVSAISNRFSNLTKFPIEDNNQPNNYNKIGPI